MGRPRKKLPRRIDGQGCYSAVEEHFEAGGKVRGFAAKPGVRMDPRTLKKIFGDENSPGRDRTHTWRGFSTRRRWP